MNRLIAHAVMLALALCVVSVKGLGLELAACVGCFSAVCGGGIATCLQAAPAFQPCAALACGPVAFGICAKPCGVLAGVAAVPSEGSVTQGGNTAFQTAQHHYHVHSMQLASAATSSALDMPTSMGMAAVSGGIEALAETGVLEMRMPICWTAWMADLPVHPISTHVTYRQWIDSAVNSAISQGIKVVVAANTSPCTWVQGVVAARMEEFFDNVHLHYGNEPQVQIENMLGMTSWGNATEEVVMVRYKRNQDWQILSRGQCHIVSQKASQNDVSAMGSLSHHWFMRTFSGGFIPALVAALTRKTALTTLSIPICSAPVAEAGLQACVACYTGCCGVSVLVCTCVDLIVNPPAFLACARANCGATCSAICRVPCFAPTP